MRKFTRSEILQRLQEQKAMKRPIIIGGAGVGLIAKLEDRAGIDLIMAYSTGPFRMDGTAPCVAYMAYGDANTITLDLGKHMFKMVKNTPIIAGIGAGDPYREIDELVGTMMDAGFSGVTNVPTAGVFNGWWRSRIDQLGAGYLEEIKMMEYCRKHDIFSVAYAFNEEEVRAMASVGTDVISAHVGATTGGLSGFNAAMSMDEACERTQAMLEAAKKENPDVIFVAHGGPFEGPKEVQICFDRTDVDGFIGASSIERLPVERAVMGIVEEFKNLKMR